jgi:hypothetical protein
LVLDQLNDDGYGTYGKNIRRRVYDTLHILSGTSLVEKRGKFV